MQDFVFHVDTKILFGEQLQHLKEECLVYGSRVLLVCGGQSVKRAGIYDEVLEALEGLQVTEFWGVEPNPRLESVREGVALARENKVQLVLALGGGSVIDAAKLIAAGAVSEEDPWELVLESERVKKALPLGTILTLAATGSEMDAISVISNTDTREKFGWSSRHILPRFSFLNPRYTFSVPERMSAAGVADIMSHAMESYFKVGSENFFADRLNEGLIKTCIHYGPRILKDPQDYEARAGLMWAGSWAINGLLSAGKPVAWAVHALEHELSAFYDLTHGVGLAILTGPYLRWALRDETRAEKIAQFGQGVFDLARTENVKEDALRAVDALEGFFKEELGLPLSLEEVGIGEEHLETMAKKIIRQKNGPLEGFVSLQEEDILEIYRACLKR